MRCELLWQANLTAVVHLSAVQAHKAAGTPLRALGAHHLLCVATSEWQSTRALDTELGELGRIASTSNPTRSQAL